MPAVLPPRRFNVVEAVDSGAETLLIDEDTSATNFMVRDALMQSVIAKEKEPITPFIDQAKNLYRQQGVSVILLQEVPELTFILLIRYFRWIPTGR